MSNYIEQVFQKYKQRGILIDTNILLLWCVGSVNKARISKFKRTKLFSQEDYESLERIFKYQDLRINTMDRGNHGGIAPTNTKYACFA